MGTGFVYVTSFQQGPAESTSLRAELWPVAPVVTCAPVVVGPCLIASCSAIPSGPGSVSAGTLTVTGGLFPIAVSPDPTSADVAYDDDENMVLFHGGETLVVAASGAEAPSFQTSVVAPSPIQSVSPSETTLATGADLVWSWMGGAGTVVVTVQASGETATCLFDAAAKNTTIPHQALDMFPRGSASVVVTERSTTTVLTAGYSIDVEIFDAKPRFQGSLTLE
jgi:hypothetical protein